MHFITKMEGALLDKAKEEYGFTELRRCKEKMYYANNAMPERLILADIPLDYTACTVSHSRGIFYQPAEDFIADIEHVHENRPTALGTLFKSGDDNRPREYVYSATFNCGDKEIHIAYKESLHHLLPNVLPVNNEELSEYVRTVSNIAGVTVLVNPKGYNLFKIPKVSKEGLIEHITSRIKGDFNKLECHQVTLNVGKEQRNIRVNIPYLLKDNEEVIKVYTERLQAVFDATIKERGIDFDDLTLDYSEFYDVVLFPM